VLCAETYQSVCDNGAPVTAAKVIGALLAVVVITIVLASAAG